MVEVKGVTNANVKTQGIKLSDRPNGIEGEVRSNDDITLRVYFRVGDVIVVLDANTRAHAKSNRAEQQVVGDTGDVLLPRFVCFLTGQRRTYRVLCIDTC